MGVAENNSELWVFAYGSLLWKPGFECLEHRHATLHGFRRRFGLSSEHYRGTPERPGLVLGLDWAPGHHCDGIAFRVCPTRDLDVRRYLSARELVSRAYFETVYPVSFPDGGGTDALCYILDRAHYQYRGNLSEDEQATIIAGAVGREGANADYLFNTVAKLGELGLPDPDLDRLAERVRALL